jgi:hypothetical protein
MPGVLVVVFWCWFAVSVAILLRRGVRKYSGGGRPAAETVRPRPEWPPLHEIDPVRDGLPVGVRDADPTAGATGRGADAGAGDVAAGAVNDANDAAPAERGVFGHPRAARTIASALDGIRLPCDLTPLLGETNDLDRRAAFYTVGYPPEAVAPEIADELERLGMRFDTVSDNVAVAKRDDVQVRVAVRSVGPAINGVADDRYPAAPANSVVVEFELA